MKVSYFLALVVLCGGTLASSADPVTLATICNGGVCEAIDPEVALVIVGVSAISDELQKKNGFGPNGEVVKAFTKLSDALEHNGVDASNELLKQTNDVIHDIQHGPGDTNSINQIINQIKNFKVSF